MAQASDTYGGVPFPSLGYRSLWPTSPKKKAAQPPVSPYKKAQTLSEFRRSAQAAPTPPMTVPLTQRAPSGYQGDFRRGTQTVTPPAPPRLVTPSYTTSFTEYQQPPSPPSLPLVGTDRYAPPPDLAARQDWAGRRTILGIAPATQAELQRILSPKGRSLETWIGAKATGAPPGVVEAVEEKVIKPVLTGLADGIKHLFGVQDSEFSQYRSATLAGKLPDMEALPTYDIQGPDLGAALRSLRQLASATAGGQIGVADLKAIADTTRMPSARAVWEAGIGRGLSWLGRQPTFQNLVLNPNTFRNYKPSQAPETVSGELGVASASGVFGGIGYLGMRLGDVTLQPFLANLAETKRTAKTPELEARLNEAIARRNASEIGIERQIAGEEVQQIAEELADREWGAFVEKTKSRLPADHEAQGALTQIQNLWRAARFTPAELDDFQQNAPIVEQLVVGLADPSNFVDFGFLSEGLRIYRANKLLREANVIVDGIKRAPTLNELQEGIRDGQRLVESWQDKLGKISGIGKPFRMSTTMGMSELVDQSADFLARFSEAAGDDAGNLLTKWIFDWRDPEVVARLGKRTAHSWWAARSWAMVRQVIGEVDETTIARMTDAVTEAERALEQARTVAYRTAERAKAAEGLVANTQARVAEQIATAEARAARLERKLSAAEVGLTEASGRFANGRIAAKTLRNAENAVANATDELALARAQVKRLQGQAQTASDVALDTARRAVANADAAVRAADDHLVAARAALSDAQQTGITLENVIKIINGAGGDKRLAVQRLAEHYEKAALAFFGEPHTVMRNGVQTVEYRLPGLNKYQKFMGAMAEFQGKFYLGYNFGYALRNASNNLITALADGVNPFTPQSVMAEFFDRWGELPVATMKGFGPGGNIEQGSARAVELAKRAQKPIGGREFVQMWRDEIDWKAGPTRSMAQLFESMASQRIMHRNLDHFWGQVWPRTVKDLGAALKANPGPLTPAQIEYFTRRLRSRMSVKEVMGVLDEMGMPVDMGRTATAAAVEVGAEAGGEAGVAAVERVARMSSAGINAAAEIADVAAEAAEAATRAAARLDELAQDVPLPSATREQKVAYLREIDKTTDDIMVGHRARVDAVGDAVDGLSTDEKAELWRQYRETERPLMREHFARVDSLEEGIAPRIGLSQATLEDARQYRRLVADYWEADDALLNHFYDAVNREKWAWRDPRRQALWQDTVAQRDALRRAMGDRRDAYMLGRANAEFEAIAFEGRPPDEPPAPAGGVPVEPAPRPPGPAPAAPAPPAPAAAVPTPPAPPKPPVPAKLQQAVTRADELAEFWKNKIGTYTKTPEGVEAGGRTGQAIGGTYDKINNRAAARKADRFAKLAKQAPEKGLSETEVAEINKAYKNMRALQHDAGAAAPTPPELPRVESPAAPVAPTKPPFRLPSIAEERPLTDDDWARWEGEFGITRPEVPKPEPTIKARPSQTIAEAAPEAVPSGTPAAFGNWTQARTADFGKKYDMRYKVMSLDDLIPSNLDDLKPNPAYPEALQPRDRSRYGSRAQIDQIIARFDPDGLLADFGVLDEGPMIVGVDDFVESGNGRTLALRIMRQEQPAKFAAYQERLPQYLGRYGLDASALEGVSDPVLVRESHNIPDREMFVREANAPTGVEMSPGELARSEGRYINDNTMRDFFVGSDQSLDEALRADSNAGFVRGFLARLSPNARAKLLTGDGRINKAGLDRIKSAMLARAYPGEAGEVLGDFMLESLDENIANLQTAINASLPRVIYAKTAIDAGQVAAELDITDDVAYVINVIARLRQSGKPVEQFITEVTGDGRLFATGDLTEFQVDLLRFFDQNRRGYKVIRDYLNAWADEATMRLGPPPDQTGFGFGETRAPARTLEEIHERAKAIATGQEVPESPVSRAAPAAPAAPARAGGEELAATPAPRTGPELPPDADTGPIAPPAPEPRTPPPAPVAPTIRPQVRPEPPAPRSFVAEFTEGGGTGYSGNALRFATREEADAYARDLMGRWFGATDYRVTESGDPVKNAWVKGEGLKYLDEPKPVNPFSDAPPPPKPPPPQPSRNVVGKNADGLDISEDANGVRHITRNGVTLTEPVGMRPVRGEDGKVRIETWVDRANRDSDFTTVEEAAARAPQVPEAPRVEPPALAPEAPTPPTEAIKKGWEMTRAEFIAAHRDRFVKHEGHRIIDGVHSLDGLEIYSLKAGDQRNGKLQRPLEDVLGDLHAQIVKGQYESYLRAQLPNVLPWERSQRPVPENVLAEYPDLAPQAAPGAPTPAARPGLAQPADAARAAYRDQASVLYRALYDSIDRAEFPETNAKLYDLARRTLPDFNPQREDDIDLLFDTVESVFGRRWAELKVKYDLTEDVLTPAAIRERLALADTIEQALPNRSRSTRLSELQQFSTPYPLAEALDTAAQVRATDVVLEPNGGTGGLVIALKGKAGKIIVNELSDRRLAIMDNLGVFDEVRKGDSLMLWREGVKADVVVMNPPWRASDTMEGAFKAGDLAERHVAMVMETLPDGGRLVALMPTTMMKAASAGFRDWLAKNHTIRAIIQAPPGMYSKRGTNVESIILVVDKGKWPNGEVIFRTVGDGSTPKDLDDLAQVLSEIAPRPVGAAQVPQELITHVKPDAARPMGRGGGGTGRPGPVPQPQPDESVRPGRRGAAGRTGDTGVVSADRSVDGQGIDTPGTPDVVPGSVQGGTSAGGGTAGERGAGAQRPIGEGVAPVRAEAGEELRARFARERAEQEEAARSSQHFTPYEIRSGQRLSPHPRAVVETKTLSGAPYPSLTYEAHDAVKASWRAGNISDEQYDVVRATGQAFDAGHGILVADDVGVGKSREIGGTLTDLFASNRAQRVLVSTRSNNNVTALIDEIRLAAGGEADKWRFVRVTDIKSAKADQMLPVFPEKTVYLIDSYNFADYAPALRKVGFDTWLADEAHIYKNQDVKIGIAWRELHQDLLRARARIAYYTATAATVPEDLEYLYALREWSPDASGFERFMRRITGNETATEKLADDAARAARGTSDSEDVMSGGKSGWGKKGDVFSGRVSLPEMEQAMRELKRKGKYISRDLWRGGVEFEVKEIDLPAPRKAMLNQVSELAREIDLTARKFAKMNPGTNSFGVRSKLQNAVKRAFFDARLDDIMADADQALARGEQVVIYTTSVNETVAGQGNLSGAINAINTQARKKLKDGTLTDPEEIPEALIAIMELREKEALLPTMRNPLQTMETHFGKQNIAFVTGQQSDTAREMMMNDFQAGRRKVVVISDAGIIGVNLHQAMPNTGRRHLMVAEYQWAADAFKQLLGRVDRSGQLSSPRITLYHTGNAAERKFISTIANRLQSLGALSKGQAGGGASVSLDAFEVFGRMGKAAMTDAWEKLTRQQRNWFIGSAFRDPNTPQVPAYHLGAEAEVRQFFLELQLMPLDVSRSIQDVFVQTYDDVAAAMSTVERVRTERSVGEVLRSTRIADDLVLHEIKNAANQRLGILEGVVMLPPPGQPSRTNAIKNALRGGDELGGGSTLSYMNFRDETSGKYISGLVIRPSRIEDVARALGASVQRAAHAIENLATDLRAGDKIKLVGPRTEEISLYMRRDGLFGIQNARIGDRVELMNAGAAFSPMGQFFHVPEENLRRFVEVFSLADRPSLGADVARKPRLFENLINPFSSMRRRMDDAGQAFDSTAAQAASRRRMSDALRLLSQGRRAESVAPLTPEQAAYLRRFLREQVAPRMTEDKLMVGQIATDMRNFALGDYTHKRNWHNWLSLNLYPYAYWYTFTYPNWAKRLAQHPMLAAQYMRYTRLLEKHNREYYKRRTGDPNAELPDYYAKSLFLKAPWGDSEFMVNIEDSLNPLKGITGMDFEPRERTAAPGGKIYNALNNWGPTQWSWQSWLYALWQNYAERNPDAAAQIWGYTVPQERLVKGLTAAARQYIPGLEKIVPPGGWTPSMLLPWNTTGDFWDTRQIPRELVELYRTGQATRGEAEEGAYAWEYDGIWGEAAQRQALRKLWPNLASFFLGQGYKPRDLTDIEIESMWQANSELGAAKGQMSKEQYAQAWLDFDRKYPWASMFKMARMRDPLERLGEFSWMVLKRIPPGTSGYAAREAAGLTEEMVSRFYDDKGEILSWSPEEQEAWRVGIENLSGALQPPTPEQLDTYAAAKEARERARSDAAAGMGGAYGAMVGLEWLKQKEQEYYTKPEGAPRAEFLTRYPELKRWWNDSRTEMRGTAAEEFYISPKDDFWYYLPPGSRWREAVNVPADIGKLLNRAYAGTATDAEYTTATQWLLTNLPDNWQDQEAFTLARQLNDQFEAKVVELWGPDVLRWNKERGALGDNKTAKAAWDKANPKARAALDEFWRFKRAFGPLNPDWQRFYGFADDTRTSSQRASSGTYTGRSSYSGGSRYYGGGYDERQQGVSALPPQPPAVPVPDWRVMPLLDFNSRLALLMRKQPRLEMLIRSMFPLDGYDLLTELLDYLALSDADRAKWLANPEYARLITALDAFMVWFDKFYQQEIGQQGQVVAFAPPSAAQAGMITPP